MKFLQKLKKGLKKGAPVANCIIITKVYGKKHEPVTVRQAHLMSFLLFVKGKKNTVIKKSLWEIGL